MKQKFPPNEIYRLVSQVTWAAASVPANLAEGPALSTRKDYANFTAIAKGSLMETETFVMRGFRLVYVSDDEAKQTLNLVTEASKMLTALRCRLRLSENQ